VAGETFWLANPEISLRLGNIMACKGNVTQCRSLQELRMHWPQNDRMLTQNEILTNTLVSIVDKLDRLMQAQNPMLPVSEKDDMPPYNNSNQKAI